ncbi:coiled-coil domain-containing protein 169 [Anguilla anguilla]|uniref:coiled-coil domain-containing protein 169 n=1 Tax=Anguilla anguilla TaxID=7936 RepID=UPI0015AA2AC2|nr:coiled-coil domain-containing protein 169 [Anguilla anguilla]
MEDTDFSNYDIGRLRAELEQETELKEMLEVSVSELRTTIVQLEKRLRNVQDEESEWRTRFETQLDLNGQLEQQICLVREKLEDLRGNPDDRLSSIRAYDDMPADALKRILEQLARDKASLQNQLTDCGRRIVQEAKAYQRANEERRAYQAELAKASPALGPCRRQQQMARPLEAADSGMKRALATQTLEMAAREPVGKPARTSTTSSRLPRLKR